MKKAVKIILLSLIFTNNLAYALNPVPGWYGGIILGGSYSPDTTIIFNAPVSLNTSCPGNACLPDVAGNLSYSGYGNIGGQVGYRFNRFRVEVEPVVNYNPYQKLSVGNVEYRHSKSSAGVRFEGSTTTAMLMANGFYDFYLCDGASDWVPYIGGGIGYAYLQNDIKFYCDNQDIACTHLSETTSTAALQGILGIAYYMDDYTWFGLDYRYITTGSSEMLNSNHVQLHTINLSFSGSFCL